MDSKYLLEMQSICKSFAGVNALQDVGFKVRPGEIHGLMGENGAGKSTLIKILTGIYTKDSGSIFFDGKEINFHTALEAQHLGISTIYQELNLIPYLSIAENIFIGREPRKAGFIDWKTMRTNAKSLLKEKLGLDIDCSLLLADCSTAISQMVALARAISINAKLVIMDEPTSSLEDAEVKILFETIRLLQERGTAVIYITHKLDELFELCNSVTILKDGQFVGEKKVSDISKLELVSKMIGRDATDIMNYKKVYKDFSVNEIVCQTRHILNGAKLKDVNISIKKGEVVGLAGLLSSGRTESAKVIFGADPNVQGELIFNNKVVSFKIPKNAIDSGIGFCTEDRKAEGIMPNMTIRDNMTIAILSKISNMGLINEDKVSSILKEYIGRLKIKTPSENQFIKYLSGGNQQKVILARWMCMNPNLLILDEPTRGIDVGAKAEIEGLIQELSEQGVSILYISSELEELIRGCDRIIVLREGRDIAELVGEEISEKSLLNAIAYSQKNLM